MENSHYLGRNERINSEICNFKSAKVCLTSSKIHLKETVCDVVVKDMRSSEQKIYQPCKHDWSMGAVKLSRNTPFGHFCLSTSSKWRVHKLNYIRMGGGKWKQFFFTEIPSIHHLDWIFGSTQYKHFVSSCLTIPRFFLKISVNTHFKSTFFLNYVFLPSEEIIT